MDRVRTSAEGALREESQGVLEFWPQQQFLQLGNDGFR